MVKVVTFPVSLHDIGAFLVVNVANWRAGVGGDALAVKPGDVRVADCVGGQGAEVGEVEGGGGYAGAVAEDAAPGGGGEHGVAEAVDEVGSRGCLGEGGDQVASAGVLEGDEA